MSKRLVPLRRIEGSPEEMSDEALIAACALGDKAALGALFDRYYDGVRRFLARLAGTDERDLDDLVQATFMTVPRAAKRFKGGSTVRTWLIGVANNVARHHVRSEIRRKRVVDDFAASPRVATVDADDAIVQRERADRLHAAILELPPKLREAFVMVYLEGISGREVAKLVGAREGTIWKRLHQARAKLRVALEGALS
jgi:RNA polymerase sigma-70 factor (ECF subfamily)